MMYVQRWTAFAFVLVLAAAGCASAPVPAERLASAEAAIRGAAEVGAQSTPQASLHLNLAREQLAQARTFIGSGQPDRAAWLLTRAEADAELALSLARESAARAEATALLTEVSAMQQRAP